MNGRKWKEALLRKFRRADVPPGPPVKEWKPKYDLPKLKTFAGVFPESYWKDWPVNTMDGEMPPTSWVKWKELENLAGALGCRDWGRLGRTLDRLKVGADIGCRGRGRIPTVGPNSGSAEEYGERVSDSLRDWVDEKLVIGPLKKEELPPGATVSPIATRLKPNGKARIILNFSYPYDLKGVPDDYYTECDPGSVNSGISSEDFPVRMSSVKKFVKCLTHSGVNCYIMKADWQNAYKHIAVREDDIPLQFIQWGGRYFAELKLVFGTVSSPGIFDDLAKLVFWIARELVSYPARLTEQHLDDAFGCGDDRRRLLSLYESYRAVADQRGVRLASEDDPEKMLKPCKEATILGVQFETDSWHWFISEEKMARIVGNLKEIVEDSEVQNQKLLSTVGRIVDVAHLVPQGRLNMGFLIKEGDSELRKSAMVIPSPQARRQAKWWLEHIQWACWRSVILDPDRGISPLAVPAFTDAAGGSYTSVGNGLGGVVFPKTWFYFNWPKNVQLNWKNEDGVGFKNKLTCLEAVGPLVAVCTGHRLIRNSAMEVFVDNQGAVDIARKGYSTSDPYSYTIIKAAFDVAHGLNAELKVTKVRRCSNVGSVIADDLSKGQLGSLKRMMPGRDVDPAHVPRVILKWLRDPFIDMDLGKAILREMSLYTDVIIPS